MTDSSEVPNNSEVPSSTEVSSSSEFSSSSERPNSDEIPNSDVSSDKDEASSAGEASNSDVSSDNAETSNAGDPPDTGDAVRGGAEPGSSVPSGSAPSGSARAGGVRASSVPLSGPLSRRPERGDDVRRHDGAAVRRQVLGDTHVDSAIVGTTAFTADFQDLITRYAWGEIWNRPGLDRRSRSMITLTALIAGGHWDELAMHVRAAVRNGLSVDEIKEVLLQTAIYCSVPSANHAFKIAQQALADEGLV